MGHNSVISGHSKFIGIPWVTGCQQDPRIWGVTRMLLFLFAPKFLYFYLIIPPFYGSILLLLLINTSVKLKNDFLVLWNDRNNVLK